MCVVSMVMDQYRPWLPEPGPWPEKSSPPWRERGTIPNREAPFTFPPEPIIDPGELRELIESFRQAVKAAEVFDRLTGQPDCVDPEKAELEDRVAELEEKLSKIKEAAQ